MVIGGNALDGAQRLRERIVAIGGDCEYPNEGFAAAFPAEPKVESTSYQASGGRLVEARVYSVVQEGGEFKVTVAGVR
jgi:hypothetical protein